MGMGIGISAWNPDQGNLKRRQTGIACGVWFTSTGNAMPKLIKYQDAEGVIRTLGPIQVLSSERNCHCGIPAWEYRFRLYYYPETCCWKLSWEE